jgi:hypothetical protein
MTRICLSFAGIRGRFSDSHGTSSLDTEQVEIIMFAYRIYVIKQFPSYYYN